MQERDKLESLDLYFWRSDDNQRLCLPWLWLGPSYRLPGAEDEDRLRNSIRKSYLYRFLSARIFLGISVLSFTAIDIYHDVPNTYLIYHVIAVFFVYLLFHIALKAKIWSRLRSMKKTNFMITYQQYVYRLVMIRGESDYLSTIEILAYTVLALLFALLLLKEDDIDLFVFFIVVMQGWLIFTVRTVRIYSKERLKTPSVEGQDHQMSSDAPSGDVGIR